MLDHGRLAVKWVALRRAQKPPTQPCPSGYSSAVGFPDFASLLTETSKIAGSQK